MYLCCVHMYIQQVHSCPLFYTTHDFSPLQVYNGPDRKARISLDVDAEGPILLIPKHAFSPDLMVGDIGHIRVTNSSRYDGDEGTITFSRRHQEAAAATTQGRDTRSSIPDPPSHASLHKVDSDSFLLLQSGRSSRSTSVCSATKSSMSYNSFAKLFERGPRSSLVRSLDSADAAAASRLSSGPSMFGPLLEPSGGRALGRDGASARGLASEEAEIERKMEARRGPCLLDCIEMNLTEVDVFSAKREQRVGGKDSFRLERQVCEVVYIN